MTGPLFCKLRARAGVLPVRNGRRSSVRAGYAARNMCRACAALGADLQHPCGAEPGFREPHPFVLALPGRIAEQMAGLVAGVGDRPLLTGDEGARDREVADLVDDQERGERRRSTRLYMPERRLGQAATPTSEIIVRRHLKVIIASLLVT